MPKPYVVGGGQHSRAAPRGSGPMTPHEILVCDACRQPIGALNSAMLFWGTERPEDGSPVMALALTHKGRCDRHGLDLSAELTWFADAQAALQRVAAMSDEYTFSAEHLGRLTRIAWAVAAVASPKERSGAARFREFWGRAR
jgi:hypothetical protein